jgi:hypothetical protein
MAGSTARSGGGLGFGVLVAAWWLAAEPSSDGAAAEHAATEATATIERIDEVSEREGEDMTADAAGHHRSLLIKLRYPVDVFGL